MSDTRFTPGPHFIMPVEHLGNPAFAVQCSDGDLLATGCLKADAQLFAAAPALYEALEVARELVLMARDYARDAGSGALIYDTGERVCAKMTNADVEAAEASVAQIDAALKQARGDQK